MNFNERMSLARISAARGSRSTDSRFDRRQPRHLRRLEWDDKPGFHWHLINWSAVADGALLVFALLVLLGMGWGALAQ